VSPAVTLYDPHGHSRSGSSASSLGSPDSSFLSVSHSPFPSGTARTPCCVSRSHLFLGSPTSPPVAWIQVRSCDAWSVLVLIACQNVPSPSPSPFLSDTIYYEEPQSHLPISVEFGTLL
jgi:hypothetical protein